MLRSVVFPSKMPIVAENLQPYGENMPALWQAYEEKSESLISAPNSVQTVLLNTKCIN